MANDHDFLNRALNDSIFYFSPVGPLLSLSSNRLIAEEKQNVTIACTATGQPSPKITWTKSVGSLPGDRIKVQDGTMKIYSVTKKDGGVYICKAENILGLATDTAQLTVFSPLRFKVSPPQEVTPVLGYTVHLPCLAESDLSPTTYWRKEGKSLLSLDSNVLSNGTLVLQNIKKSHEGSYICRASNPLTTIEAKVKINSPVMAASCSVIKRYVRSISGNYVIDPDGECYNSGLWFYIPTGWWMSRDSASMTYWGGASPGSRKCACGMTNSCADSRYSCNCDKNDPVWREDSGLLTDKTKLPVKQLRFGDVESGEEGYHTLGKLKCFGIA